MRNGMYARKKKNHSIRCCGKKAKRFSNKSETKGERLREIAEKDLHDKSKLTDFGEGCS